MQMRRLLITLLLAVGVASLNAQSAIAGVGLYGTTPIAMLNGGAGYGATAYAPASYGATAYAPASFTLTGYNANLRKSRDKGTGERGVLEQFWPLFVAIGILIAEHFWK